MYKMLLFLTVEGKQMLTMGLRHYNEVKVKLSCLTW